MNRRILAWIGLAYMAIFLGLSFYAFYTGGLITGIAGLMICPAAAGLAVNAIYTYRKGERERNSMLFLVALCAVAFGLGLYLGIPSLLQNF